MQNIKQTLQAQTQVYQCFNTNWGNELKNGNWKGEPNWGPLPLCFEGKTSFGIFNLKSIFFHLSLNLGNIPNGSNLKAKNWPILLKECVDKFSISFIEHANKKINTH
jgi:hypothetical protein